MCVMRLEPDTNLVQISTLSRSYREWGGALESPPDRNSDKCPGSLEQNTCAHTPLALSYRLQELRGIALDRGHTAQPITGHGTYCKLGRCHPLFDWSAG